MATPPAFTAGSVLTAAQMNGIGLWLVKTQTIGSAVSSVTVTGAFSADYDNYLITVSGGVASGTQNLAMTLGATSAGYYMGGAKFNYATAATTALNTNNGASFARALTVTANTLDNAVYVFSPNLAKRTSIVCMSGTTDTGEGFYMHGGFLNDATQYTEFTLTPSGTVTGGEIRVYGLRN